MDTHHYTGGVDSGLVIVGDPNELMKLAGNHERDQLKAMITSLERKHKSIVDYPNHNSKVLVKVSDRPCSLRVSFKKCPGKTNYKRVILGDISYDVNKPTRANRVITHSGYLTISDPCYIIYRGNDEKWKNWFTNESFKYDDNGYMLYATFQRDDGEFEVILQEDHIEIDEVFGYDR
jgi:hypothetical protein